MVGKDYEPVDLSQEENEKAFQKDIGAWSDKMSNDTGFYSYGYIDFHSIKPAPYGTAR